MTKRRRQLVYGALYGWIAGCVLALIGLAVMHPDLTPLRFAFTYWPWYAGLFGAIVVLGWVHR